MQKELDKAIEKFKNSQTSFESHEAISDFIKIVIEIPAFIEQAEKEGEIINNAKIELNADKGLDLSSSDRKQHNKRRDMQSKALHQLDPLFPLQNLHNVHIGIQPENIPYSVAWLYAWFSPDEPMRESDKKEYQLFIDKIYKKVIPFLGAKDEIDPQESEVLKFKNYDEETKTLTIGKYAIQIAKNDGDNNAHDIMTHIFVNNKDDLKIKFDDADIAGKMFGFDYNAKDKYSHQPYSGACKRINNKIQLETNGRIKNFLDFNYSTRGYVKINQKYL